MQELEAFCQEEKEWLLTVWDGLDAKHETSDSERSETMSREVKQLYQQVYQFVDEIRHLQRYKLELQQKLEMEKMCAEEKKTRAALKRAFGDPEEALKDVHLKKWNAEINKHLSQKKADFLESSGKDLYTNCNIFVNVKTSSIDKDVLEFTTQFHGVIVSVSVRAAEASLPEKYKFTASMRIDGLQEKGELYLAQNKPASSFVTEVIWPYLEQELLPYLVS